jgi:hypothetical protein
LSFWVSFHLPLSSTLGYERGISAVPRDRRRRFRGTRRHKLEVVKDLHQLKKLKNLSQGPVRRPAGLNSPATRPSAGFVMREIQTGLHKPEGGTKQRLTKSADNSAPVCFPNCASICLGSRVSFDLPLALIPRQCGIRGGAISEDRSRGYDMGNPFSCILSYPASRLEILELFCLKPLISP